MKIRDYDPSQGQAYQGDVSIIPVPEGIVISTVQEIAPVNGPDARAGGELGHADETGVREAHRLVGIFGSQREHCRQLLGKDEALVEHQVSSRDQPQEPDRIRKKTSRFGEHRFARENGERFLKAAAAQE